MNPAERRKRVDEIKLAMSSGATPLFILGLLEWARASSRAFLELEAEILQAGSETYRDAEIKAVRAKILKAALAEGGARAVPGGLTN